MQILNNLVPNMYQEQLEKSISHEDFPWYFCKSTNDSYSFSGIHMVEDKLAKESPQFVHSFFRAGQKCSPYAEMVYPILYFLENSGFKVERAKANLLLKEDSYPETCYHPAHSDVANRTDFKSLVYYVNDSDGDTYFFNEFETSQKIHKLSVAHRETPKRGNAVLFQSNRMHASSPPKIHETRIVINFVLY